MELDISRFFNEAAPMDYSASVAEIGTSAGAYTWRAACDDSPDYMMLDDDDKRDAFKDYVRSFGAWTDAEIAAWTNTELNALLIQFIAGDMREAGLKAGSTDGDWAAYAASENAGRLFYAKDGTVYYYIGE